MMHARVIQMSPIYGIEPRVGQSSRFLAFPRPITDGQDSLWPQRQRKLIKLLEKDHRVVVLNWLISFTLLACVTALYWFDHRGNANEHVMKTMAVLFAGMAVITFAYGSIALNWFSVKQSVPRFITIAKANLR